MQGIFIALNGMPEVTPGNTNKPSFTTFKIKWVYPLVVEDVSNTQPTLMTGHLFYGEYKSLSMNTLLA